MEKIKENKQYLYSHSEDCSSGRSGPLEVIAVFHAVLIWESIQKAHTQVPKGFRGYIFFKIDFLERGKKNTHWLPSTEHPNQRSNPKPGHVPWLGMETTEPHWPGLNNYFNKCYLNENNSSGKINYLPHLKIDISLQFKSYVLQILLGWGGF